LTKGSAYPLLNFIGCR